MIYSEARSNRYSMRRCQNGFSKIEIYATCFLLLETSQKDQSGPARYSGATWLFESGLRT